MVAILIALMILIVLAYRKVNIIFAAILSASILALLSGLPVLDTMLTNYMGGTAGFIEANFLIFFFSVLFGRTMEITGSAASISNFLANILGERLAILGVIFSGAVLVYGGVTTLVVIFSLYPIALNLFKRADLPRKLLPGAIAAGSFTFAAAFYPGTPQLMNVIPIPYLNTSVNAGALIGFVAGTVVMLLISFYFLWEAKKAKEAGLHFDEDEQVRESLAQASSLDELPSPIIALLPILVILIVLNLLKMHVVIAMIAGILTNFLLLYKNIDDVHELLAYAGRNAAITVISTAAIVGFGAVVRETAGFAQLIASVENFGAHPYINFSAMTTIVAGATGSGTGGLGIALEALAPSYLEMGLNPAVLHRLGSIAGVGLDSLPHNSAVVMILVISGLSHKETYKHIFIPTVVFTLIGLVVAVGMAMVLYPV